MKEKISNVIPTEKLIIFTEAGTHIGLGHFTRMSGICESAKKKEIPVKMYLDTDPELQELLKRDFVEFFQWRAQEAALEKLAGKETVIVDSYKVSLPFLERVKERCGNLIVIDDNYRLPYRNMRILNPNYYAKTLGYPNDCENQYMLGKDYTLLRQEFYEDFSRNVKRTVGNILITIGGTDVQGLTGRLVSIIKKFAPQVSLQIVATDAFSDLDHIRAGLGVEDTLHMNVSASKMRDLMLSCDFAIAAAGGTSNELIKLQCPSALFVVADNQLRNASFMKERNLAKIMEAERMEEFSELFSYENRINMVRELSKFASDKSGTQAILDIVKGKKNDQ